MEEYEKEGEIQGAIGAVIMLITGIGVSVLVLIFVGALGGQTYNLVEPDIDAISTEVINESSTTGGAGVTVTSLAHNPVAEDSITRISNTSHTIGIGNFTIDYNAGTYVLNNDLLNTTAYDWSYTYGNPDIEGNVRESIAASFSALQTTADYTPIIVLAVVVFLVLTIVLGLGAFSGRGSSSGGTVL